MPRPEYMISHENSRSGRVIVFAAQKGGVGKTTNCVHIAAALGAIGHKCLVWDLDSNLGATLHFGLEGDDLLGTFEILLAKTRPLKAVITEDDANLPTNVHLIPAGHDVEAVGRLRAETEVSRQMATSLSALRQRYDYILLDTAPNLTIPTIAAYRTADWVVLSTTPNPLAIFGMKSTLQFLKLAAERESANGRLLGVVLCCVERPRKFAKIGNRRTSFHRELMDYIDERLTTKTGESLQFQTTIFDDAVVPRVQAEGKTLLQVEPRHPIVTQYCNLANEIVDRIHRIEDAAEVLEDTGKR